MVLSGFLPVAGRRALVVLAVAALVAVTTTSSMKASAPGQQAPAAAADPFKFDAPCLVFLTLKPAGLEPFEQTMKSVFEALKKSEKAERKTQLAHWKVLKGAAQADGSVIYFWQLDEVNKDVTYNPFLIMTEGGMSNADVKAMFDKVNPNIAGINRMDVTVLIDGKGGN